MVKRYFTRFFDGLKEKIINEKQRIRVQFFVFYISFAIVAAVMTILNIVTKKNISLTIATAAFSGALLINIVLHYFGGIPSKIASGLFAAEIVALFAFFIISGHPEGFSVIWIAMLPNFGLLLYRTKKGSVFSLAVFLMLVFFFWTPIGKTFLQYDYNPTFMMRFPIVYLVFYGVAMLLESIRILTYRELVKTQNRMEQAYTHDALTGVYNRHGFREVERRIISENGRVAFALFDIDSFKAINDVFGHQIGDVVLKETAKIAENRIAGRGELCRWGGEEFVILFPDRTCAETVCNDILVAMREKQFDLGTEKRSVTVSFGLVTSNVGDPDPDKLLKQADDCMYEAKRSGKDRMVVREYTA